MEIKFKKFQNGGNFAPFLSIYQPLQLNDQVPNATLAYLANMNAQTQQELMADLNGTSKTSTKSATSQKQSINQTEKLLQDLRGLDSDVQQVTQILYKQSMTNNIPLLGDQSNVQDYYTAINLVNKVIDSKEEYKQAFEIAKSNKALSEAAITADGQVVLQTSNGYTMATPSKAIKAIQAGKARVCKNSDLLNSRRHDPNMAFNNELLNIVQNSVSFDSIKDTINSIATNLGSKEFRYSGYSKVQQGKIESGLRALGDDIANQSAAGHTVDGTYKDSYHTKSNAQNIAYALNAIYSNLSSTQIAYLQLHSDGTAKGAKELIQQILMAKYNDSTTFDSNLQKDLDDNGQKINKKSGSKSDGKDDKKTKPTSAPEQFVAGTGYSQQITLAPGTSYAFVGLGRYGTLASDQLGSGSTLQQVSRSKWAPILDLSNASMAGQTIKHLDQVILNNSDVIGMDLPVMTDENGRIKPDYDLLKKAEALNKVLVSEGIEDSPENAEEINSICKDLKLEPKYIKDPDGKWELNQKSYSRFAIIDATASEEAFDMDAPEKFIPDVIHQGDDATSKWFEDTMKKVYDNKKYKLDSDVYSSKIFIPVRLNAVAAASAQDSSYAYKIGITDLNEADALARANQDFMNKRDQYQNPGSLEDYEDDED